MRGLATVWRRGNLYPEWFDAEPGAFPRWYPDNLACSSIDACVAELSRQGESGDAPSDAVEAMVLELVDYLDAPEAQVACARRVSHLMTEDMQEMTVAGVTILAQRRWEEIRQIADVIPTARAAFNGDPPFSFAPPEATLVSYATGPDPFKLRAAAESCIDRLLLAIHLLDGATTAGVFQVTGETTLVCRYSAGVDVLVYDEHPVPVRPAVISPASVQPVERLLALYDGTEHRAPKEVVHGLQMAVLKFTTSFAPKPWFEKVVDLTTALEATLSGTDKADVTMRICSRAGQILSTDRDSPQTIYGDVKALFDLRSNLVHGSVITEKQLDKWIATVSVVSPDRTPRMRIELVVDRLRDLVRRSILARLVLNDDGRWRLRGDPPPIDQSLADPGTAAKWRKAWHQRMGELGAAEAVRSWLRHHVFATIGIRSRRRGGGLKAWLRWLGNHPGGEQLAEFDPGFLTAGDPGCLERVRGRPVAVREACRWYGRRRATGLDQPPGQRLGARSGNEPAAVREAFSCHPA